MAIDLSKDEQYILDSLSPTVEDNAVVGMSSFDMSDDEQYLLQALEPSFQPVDPSAITKIGIDPNSTANKWDIATDQAGEMIYDGLALFADTFGADDQALEWRKVSDQYKESSASKPKPEISMSITEEAPKILDKFSEGEILEAISDTGDFVHSVLVGVAPSMLATGAAVGTGAVAGGVLAAIGAGSIPAALTTLIIGMTPATLMSSGQIYEEALKYGASEEDAQKVGIGGGSIVGALDRFFFSSFLGSLVRKLGPETTIKAAKEMTNLSDSMIRDAVKKAASTGGKGLLVEGTTESLQTITEEISPTLVSDKEIELADLTKKTIDSFAAGGIGGGFVGTIVGGVSVPVARQAIKQAEDLDAEIEALQGGLNEQLELDLNVAQPEKVSDLEIEEITVTDRQPRKGTQGTLDLFPEEEIDTTARDQRDTELQQEVDELTAAYEQDQSLEDIRIGLTAREEEASGLNITSEEGEIKFERLRELDNKQKNAGKPLPDKKVKSLKERVEIVKKDLKKLRFNNRNSKFTTKTGLQIRSAVRKRVRFFVLNPKDKIQDWQAKADATPEQIQEIENIKQAERDISKQKEFITEQKSLNKVLNNVDKKAVEKGESLTAEERAERTQLRKDLTRKEKATLSSLFRNVVSRSTTKLAELANTIPIAGQLVNELRNIQFNDNAAIGTFFKRKELINDKIRRAFKLPFQSSIPMNIKVQIADQLSGRKEATDPIAREVANEIKKEIFDKLYVVARASGLELGRIEEYLPTIYKFRMKGLGRKKDIAKFTDILKKYVDDPDVVISNILTNDGVFAPDEELDIFSPDPDIVDPVAVRKGFEKTRVIPPEAVRELAEAGLVEKDFDKITNKYITDTIRRANLNRFVTKYRPVVNELYRSGLMTKKEGERIKNIVDALQSRYKPIEGLGIRSAYRFVNSLTYILTLPLAGITALTEPLIVLHKVSPKHAIYGLMDASIIGLRKGIRSFLPKFSKSEKEKSLMSLMQTADLALVDAQRDIGDISVSKKVTDKFFRLNLLAQVTQFSRYMAYHAGKRQMAEDIELLQAEQLKGSKPTLKSRQARKRLMIEGLGNIIPKIDQKTDTVEQATPEQLEVLTWFSEGMNNETTPEIVNRALGKLVDEVIMTPNVVNKPLWMSNPYLSPVAQLKGFMMVFGNTVGMRMYKDVFRPLYKGRLPAGEIAKYAMTFALLSSAIMGTQVIKNTIRYGDDESPWDRLSEWEKLFSALQQSNIFGFGNVFVDALRAERFGLDPITLLLGPAAAKTSGLIKALGSGSPQKIATALGNITPGIASLSAGTKRFATEPIKETIEELIE